MKAVGNNILNGRKLVLPLRLWRTNTPCHPRPSHVPGQTHSNCDSQNNRANVSHYISVLNTLDALTRVYCGYRPLGQPDFVQNRPFSVSPMNDIVALKGVAHAPQKQPPPQNLLSTTHAQQ